MRPERICVRCGVPTRDGFGHCTCGRFTGHGMNGHPCCEPVCVTCLRIAVWGSPEPPPFGRKRKQRKKVLP